MLLVSRDFDTLCGFSNYNIDNIIIVIIKALYQMC